MRRLRVLSVLAAGLVLTGCVSTYAMVAPGQVNVQGLQLDVPRAWNQAPPMVVPYARKTAQVWTRDGLLLDRLIVVPGVASGESLFVSPQKDAAFPIYRASMLPNELEELSESSIVKVFGEGNASVSTSGLRPHRFGDDRGVLFDVEIAVTDGPEYRGLVGSFSAGDRLYWIMYVAAVPYYFDKTLAEAEGIITAARLAPVAEGDG